MTAGQKEDPSTGAPRKRRWLIPLVIVSVGLNLLFVGLVAGRMWAGFHGPPGSPHRIVTRAVEKFSAKLRGPQKKHARELLDRQREGNKALGKKLRKARKDAKAAALAVTYDEGKLAAALKRLREIRTSQHQAMHEMVLELLKDLSLEERKILLRYVRAGFRPHRRWDRPRNGPKENGAPRGQ